MSWNGVPVWVVSFEGGDVCSPTTAPLPPDAGEYCMGNTENVKIDATTGEWIDTFADGVPTPMQDTASLPTRSETSLLHG